MRTAEEILKDIIQETSLMADGTTPPVWFGPFDGNMAHDGYHVSWPNLDMLVKEAETALGVGK